jgi:hypothetical protein
MSDDRKLAGEYELISFEITSFPDEGKTIDMKAVVHIWELEESMLKGNIRGTAKIYDATGIFYNFPLRGQEKLKITYKDFFDEEREEELFIYMIGDINPVGQNDDSILEYTLHFCSYGKFWSDRYEIKRCIAEGTEGGRRYIPVNEQVQVIYDDYYATEGQGTKKEIEIHETDGEQVVIIPDYKPEDAMHLMTRRSYSATYPSNMYRFFENRDKYYFINIEKWIEDYSTDEVSQPTYVYARSMPDQTPQGEADKMNTLINLSFGSYTNTLDRMNGGGYYRKVAEIDFQSRTIQEYEYDHLEEYKDYIWPDKTPETQLRHTDQMITEHLNKRHTTYVFKDYSEESGSSPYGLRPTPYYGEIYNNKIAMMNEYSDSRITATIFGNNKIVAGSMIFVDLPKFKPSSVSDTRLSERYIVESVKNEFIENTYYQNLTLIKGPMLIELEENT